MLQSGKKSNMISDFALVTIIRFGLVFLAANHGCNYEVVSCVSIVELHGRVSRMCLM